tara:strand:+ start:324 stop:683 length:360 start_codon:yes stop_codon:yes gene_type:complete
LTDYKSDHVKKSIEIMLASALALMFTSDEDAPESAVMIAQGIFTLVKECKNPEQAIGVALACALGAALIGDAVDDLTHMATNLGEDGENLQEMKRAFHNIINATEPNNMSEAKTSGSVH